MTDPTPIKLGRALDPAVVMATSVHSMPGVMVVLLGSGVSRAAGIPTGWGVVQQLVRQAATAHAPDDPKASDLAAADPEAWWATNGDGHPLGYSNLLEQLGPTPGARQALLAGFFEATDEERQAGLKLPTKAHVSIAEMAAKGYIRVILTTNFDRLMERALEDAGVSPQVVSGPESIEAMTPPAHAPVTVVKLHGDYTELAMRNTIDELSEYPAVVDSLVERIFDEYGVMISGWSAEWDKALVGCFKKCSTRRYPLYWDSRSSSSETAKQIIALRSGIVVEGASADDLFYDLSQRVAALERMASAPITKEIALERLKRYVPNPLHRVDLELLFDDQGAYS